MTKTYFKLELPSKRALDNCPWNKFLAKQFKRGRNTYAISELSWKICREYYNGLYIPHLQKLLG